ncbi:MAG: EscU/YscU/HrcU family type III secretion system export apparatus switch protein, partial [Treponemataceae bacterium]|nr:EscU/YscU/HrcU family type III secretion system export apparatus switch protein [Treponemataceae bacterium]
ANLIQNRGMIYSLKPIEPKFSKIIPKFGEYFKNTLFSMKGAFNVAKSVGKVAVIVAAAYLLLRRNIPVLLFAIQAGNIVGAMGNIAWIAAQLLLISAAFFIVVSIPDYFVNRREFMESMKMTKHEVKQEYKEMEGDPEVKNRLKQAQRQLLQQNMPKAVRESDVVITNPTHFAVSMKYDRAVADSPKVTAKGADEAAFQMRRIASENGIPVVENRPLARGLYTDTEVGDIIPDKYLAVLANVYAEIMKYRSKNVE